MLNYLSFHLGTNIFYNINVVSEEIVKRTWKERLFSLPWKPFLKTKTIIKPAIYQVGNDIIAHPFYKDKLLNI